MKFFLGQTGEAMGEHRLIKEAGIKPQEDAIIGSGCVQFLVLLAKRGQDMLFFKLPAVVFSSNKARA